ncbi:MAG: hypothetical protein IJB94_02145 [Clostridia bacterium]|nr:hypothetical protein [Clostridia bacterium]
MKKIFLMLTFILSFILSLVGCNNTYYWEFNYSYEKVDQIKIIEIIDDLDDDLDYREIQEIDVSLSKELYNDIMNIEMKRYSPNLSSPSGKCFLIVFENGEYDIISQKESKHFKYNGEEILAYNSWLYCNENEFNELINKYFNK